MRIITSTVPGSGRLKRVAVLSRMAKQRLKWLDYYQAQGENAALTCRYYGISRQTFYRWKRRYNPRDLTTLEERSHRPQQVRRPTWSPELAQTVLKHFTARDVISRWDVLEVHTRATANTARAFLDTL